MMRFSLRDFPIACKTVLVRVDYNVPLEKNVVLDDTKIRASLPTIRFLLEKKCRIILVTHLGRPEGKFIPHLKTDPLARELQRLLPRQKITKLDDCLGQDVKDKIRMGKAGEIFLLENVRFYHEEEENNPIFAHALANLADIYVNNAFADCHRRHASIEAITAFLPAIPGFLVEEEIHHLQAALHPKKPAIWILGGAKLEKLKIFEQSLKKADYILIGGALAFPFLAVQGRHVGNAALTAESKRIAKAMLKKFADKLILPVDVLVSEKMSSSAPAASVSTENISSRQIPLDIGPQTIKLFQHYLKKAHTIVWNGPLGYFEWAKFAAGTREIGRFIGKLTAISICGGGETTEAIKKFHLEYGFTHISTGGGASIAFLSGQKLPGIIALEKNVKIFGKGK